MISTRGRYALRVLLDLAEQDPEAYIPLKDIAERQDISKKYLEVIVKDLVTSGLLQSMSGKGGGYRLSRPAGDYQIGEILETMEGPLASVACLADRNYQCSRKDKCKTLPLWEEFDQLVHDFFYGKNLTDLL